MPIPGFPIPGAGGGSFDFGDFKGGDIRSGPISIDARTTTGGGDPELLGQVMPLAVVIGIAFVAMIALRKL